MSHSSGKHLRWIPRLLLLGFGVAWVAFCGYHPPRIGRMLMPSSQAMALGICFVVGIGLAAAWVCLGLRTIGRLLGRTLEPSLLDRRWVRVTLILSLLLSVTGYLYGRYVEPRRIVVREVALGTEDTGAPSARLAVISDLHIDGDRPPWTNLAAAVNRTKPDLILLLGDTLNRPGSLPVLHRTLRAMKARHGKFAVAGNWEAWYWIDLPLLRGTGFRWLRGKPATRTIRGVTVHLVGLPYRDADHGRRPERLLSRLPTPGWRVFVYHTPDLAPEVPSAHLYLAGHTHGGQVSLPLFGALVTLSRHGKRFERGLQWVGSTAVYTNPGIGVEPMVPLRIGVPPEVTVVSLRGNAP
jgi:predicted MPP superfamily phosphohydrolase